MRRRMCPNIGLGVSRPDILTNTGKPRAVHRRMAKAMEKHFMKGDYVMDYDIDYDSVKIGSEPSYQYQNLTVITIHRNKSLSTITTGRAFSHYGTGIRSRTRIYRDFKYRSKFVRFVDRWHSELFPFDSSCNGYSYHVHTPGADRCSICGKELAKIRETRGA